jgi:PAS domain S-box-containing protein
MSLNKANSWVPTVKPADQPGSKPLRAGAQKNWTLAPFVLLVASAVLFTTVLVANVESERIVLALRISLTGAALVFVLLLADVIRKVRLTEKEAKSVFEDNLQDFRHMAENIQEIFWMMDPRTKMATFVNPAYETITGRSCESLIEEPASYEQAIHPSDRSHVLQKLAEAAQSGHFEEQFRIVRPDGDIRWVWVHGFPRKDLNGSIVRLGGTALDITAQKEAEGQVAANLAKAHSAWAEAEALRKATLALTEDLHMDRVLDALLRSLAELVPYTCARVLVPECGPHWLALGEKSLPEPAQKFTRIPLTFNAEESPFFHRILSERTRVCVRDTKNEDGWETFEGHQQLRSWICVPLVASGEFLGFLSAGHTEPNQFTPDHLRRAELLAIPAAVAIQNARLYSTAEMYGSELEKRLADLERAERALGQSEEARRASKETFEHIFHSSPVAFSITTLEEGRFLEVNAAFECRYGYSRQEVIGLTVHELRIWEDPAFQRLLIDQLRQGSPIRSVIASLRNKSGEIRLAVYSANRIEVEGQLCILAVFEDVVSHDPKRSH